MHYARDVRSSEDFADFRHLCETFATPPGLWLQHAHNSTAGMTRQVRGASRCVSPDGLDLIRAVGSV